MDGYGMSKTVASCKQSGSLSVNVAYVRQPDLYISHSSVVSHKQTQHQQRWSKESRVWPWSKMCFNTSYCFIFLFCQIELIIEFFLFVFSLAPSWTCGSVWPSVTKRSSSGKPAEKEWCWASRSCWTWRSRVSFPALRRRWGPVV